MKTIAVLGSSSGLEASESLADKLGKIIAEKGFTLITGAGEGLPLKAAASAKKAGGLVIGMSAEENAAAHKKAHPKQKDEFTFVAYTGFGKKGRNVVLVRSADAVVTVGGSIGTLNEFTIAYDEGKVIGVLEGSGGVSDQIRELEKLGQYKKTGAKMIYSNDPRKLIDAVAKSLA